MIVNILGKEITEFSRKRDANGYYILTHEADNDNTSKAGLMDSYGNLILAIEYDGIESLGSQYGGIQFGGLYANVFSVKKNSDQNNYDHNYALYNTSTRNSLEYTYKYISKVHKDALVVNKDTMYGLIDPYLNEILPFEYQYLDGDRLPNFLIATKDNGVGIIDKHGNILTPFEYDQIKNTNESFIELMKDKLWGYANNEGKLIFKHQLEKTQRCYGKEYCIVEKNALKGVIDQTGKLVVPYEYAQISILNEDMFAVCDGDKFGIINSKGSIVTAPKYDKILRFIKGMAVLKLDDKFGVINRQGEIIIPIKFDKIRNQNEAIRTRYSYSSGINSNFEVSYGALKFVLNKHGKCIENCPPLKVLEEIME